MPGPSSQTSRTIESCSRSQPCGVLNAIAERHTANALCCPGPASWFFKVQLVWRGPRHLSLNRGRFGFARSRNHEA